MFNATMLLADALGRHLAETYQRIYGGQEPEYGRILDSAGKLVIERIANSDALYHNTNHTALVTLVGEAILRGRLLSQPVRPADWLHFMLALLAHDIGYVRGACRETNRTALSSTSPARRSACHAARRTQRWHPIT